MARDISNSPGHEQNGNISKNESILDNLKSYLDSGVKQIEELKLALQSKEDMIQTLSNQISKLENELADSEKRGAAMLEYKLSQFDQMIRASVEIALGRDFNENGAVVEEYKLKEIIQMDTRKLPESSSEFSGNEGDMSDNEKMPVVDDIDMGPGESGSHLQVTWSSISPDCREKVKETLEQHYLNDENIAAKLEGPILVELMNGRMPPEQDLFESIIKSQFSKYKAASGESGFSVIELVDMHVKLAVEKIFPWHSQKLASQFNLRPDWKEEIPNVGIVGIGHPDGDIKFSEERFANYFLARWLVDRLMDDKCWNYELTSFLIKAVLETKLNKFNDPDCKNDDDEYSDTSDQDSDEDYHFELDYSGSSDAKQDPKYPKCFTFLQEEICFFLNLILGEQNGSLQAQPIDFTEVCQEADITTIGLACIHNEFSDLFKLILKLGTFKGCGIAHLLFANSAIVVAIRNADLEFFKIAKSSFKNDCWMNVDLKVQAVKEAAQQGDLPMAEFFLDEMGMSEMVKDSNNMLADVIPFFTENSRDNSDELIEKKIKILQLLNSVNPSLKNEASTRRKGLKTESVGPPLLGYGVHSRLLTELIQLGADVHAVDNDNDTFLHWIAGPNEVFESLLNIISDEDLKKLVHVKGFLGDTPLMRVVRWATPTRQMLEKLLEAGADINVVDNEGYSVIAVAIKQGKSAYLVNLLMDLGAGITWRGRKNETLLHLAGGHVRSAIVCLLLENKMDPNCKDDVGSTPLDYLLQLENNEDKSFVMGTGITLRNAGSTFNDIIDEEGQTLLHRKARAGSSYLVKLLIELGFNVNEVDKHGNTPLHLAVDGWWHQFEKVELLLSKNANPNAMNAKGETPLLLCLKNWESLSLDTFQLLKSRTEMSLVVLALEYVISQCTEHSPEELWELLFSLGLDRKEYFYHENKDGNSLLHIATICGNEGAVKLLVLEGLEINNRNKLLQTALHVAANLKEKDMAIRMAKCLIDNGADPGLKDWEEFTFLHRFIMVGYIELDQFNRLVEYLLLRDSQDLFNIRGGPDGSTPLQGAVKLLDIKNKTVKRLSFCWRMA